MRLIDADLLSEDAFEVQTQEYGNIEVVGLDAIDSMVTINAETVVHCGDCKFLGDENLGLHDCDHHRGPMRAELDDFCSYGERKCD